MSEENSKKTIIETASLITIVGVLLYQLGWSYWQTYLNNLHIDSSFIEISVEKIISTTWTTVILVFACFLRSIEDIFKLKPNDSISLSNVILYISFGFLLIYFTNNLSDINYTWLIVIIFFYLAIIIFEKKIDKIGNVNRKKYILILFISVYLISAFYYPYKGNKDSKKILSDYTNDIEILLNHDNRIIKGKFITYMNDKYFILIENQQCKRETLVINNSEIYHTKFIK